MHIIKRNLSLTTLSLCEIVHHGRQQNAIAVQAPSHAHRGDQRRTHTEALFTMAK